MSKQFISITNKDIYNKLNELIEKNQIEHSEICKRLDTTNGKVKFNTFISRSALTLAILALSLITGINLFF